MRPLHVGLFGNNLAMDWMLSEVFSTLHRMIRYGSGLGAPFHQYAGDEAVAQGPGPARLAAATRHLSRMLQDAQDPLLGRGYGLRGIAPGCLGGIPGRRAVPEPCAV